MAHALNSEEAKKVSQPLSQNNTSNSKNAPPSPTEEPSSFAKAATLIKKTAIKGTKYATKKSKERLSMEGQLKQARISLERYIDPKILNKQIDKDTQIPKWILRRAKGIVFLTVIKAGFLFAGNIGTGCIIMRNENGSWSGPSSIGVAGVSFGFLAGASKIDYIMILPDDKTVKQFTGRGQLRIGGEIQLAVGPLGRDASGSLGAGDKGVSIIYSYSHSQGLYGGLALDGKIISVRPDCNETFYQKNVSCADILNGSIDIIENEDYDMIVHLLGNYGLDPDEYKSQHLYEQLWNLQNGGILRKVERSINKLDSFISHKTLFLTTGQRFRYLVVLDFEATCGKGINRKQQEIIEWPAIIIDTKTMTILSNKRNKFHYYIKPKYHPQLTKYCQKLTGITQQFIDENGTQNTIQSVIRKWNKWCYLNDLLPDNAGAPNACIVTCSDSDLKTIWPTQQKIIYDIWDDDVALFHSWIDIQTVFKQNITDYKGGYGLMSMLKYLNMEPEGRHHCGMDDARNTGKIVVKLLEMGIKFEYTTEQHGIVNDLIIRDHNLGEKWDSGDEYD